MRSELYMRNAGGQRDLHHHCPVMNYKGLSKIDCNGQAKMGITFKIHSLGASAKRTNSGLPKKCDIGLQEKIVKDPKGL